MSSRVNLLAPEVRANPYPVFAELRRNAPVSQVDPGGLWAVTRYADAAAVLKNPQLFASEGFRQAYRPAWFSDYPMADSMLVMDPPHHTRLRALVNRAFGPPVLTRLEPRIRQFVEQLAAGLPTGRSVDFAEEWSVRIPLIVMADLLGLSPEVHPRLKRWADTFGSFTGIGPNDTERQEHMRATVAEARQHFQQVLEERRREPRDDLMSDLLRARVDGEALTDAELMGFMFLLVVAGMETTVHLMNHSAIRFRDEPELMGRLRADHSLIPRFVEEILRYEPPVHGIFRVTTQETELGGVRLPKGARMLVVLCSANRDEAQFPGADRFNLDRPGPQNLPFGHGIHFCLGAQLARLEARLGTEALVTRFSRLSPGEGPVRWNTSLVVRGPLSLPLVAHPA
ncbi:cytochrome P450 [Archangium gephyra]|uniref:Cytochrome P450 n=1 Tax=Archangium gephyra TaxID=48 RepID=A0AAC8QEX1_9BACT|nr:cytochrome P450 [Archangium gephyra]AKJ05915.1 putative cytochrome P450 hydroxylase [Archangium gephyra]REG27331.1 cytochrome P450 [Archangium gephyra]